MPLWKINEDVVPLWKINEDVDLRGIFESEYRFIAVAFDEQIEYSIYKDEYNQYSVRRIEIESGDLLIDDDDLNEDIGLTVTDHQAIGCLKGYIKEAATLEKDMFAGFGLTWEELSGASL